MVIERARKLLFFVWRLRTVFATRGLTDRDRQLGTVTAVAHNILAASP